MNFKTVRKHHADRWRMTSNYRRQTNRSSSSSWEYTSEMPWFNPNPPLPNYLQYMGPIYGIIPDMEQQGKHTIPLIDNLH